MNSNSFLDTIQSLLFHPSMLSAWLPMLVFRAAILWLAVAGWSRHRSKAFLFFLGSGISGVIASLLMMRIYSGVDRVPSGGFALASLGTQFSYIATGFLICGLWHLVFHCRITPRED
jgi:hypothetical protein